MKCITFDKEAQEALPEHIKAKMKADRERAMLKSELSRMLTKYGQYEEQRDYNRVTNLLNRV